MTRNQAILGSIVFFILAPGILSGLVPTLLITGGWVTPPVFGLTFLPWLGWALIAIGTLLLIDTFVRFIQQNGTPAPVAPTPRLVVSGPYRYVRNPMYLAVLLTIIGQALVYGCHWVLLYAAGFWLATHLFIVFYEEPTLRRSFPDDYVDYFANVPRWLPRLSPWQQGLPAGA